MHSEKAMATHSSVLAWRIPGTGEPGGLPSVGSYRVGHDWSDLAAAAAAEYTAEFTFGVLSSGNKIDICVHKNLPHQFAMQKLSANLNTVFKTRNQLFGYGEDGLYHVVKFAWQPLYFLWRQNNLSTSENVSVGMVIVIAIFQITVDVGIFLQQSLRYTIIDLNCPPSHIIWIKWLAFQNMGGRHSLGSLNGKSQSKGKNVIWTVCELVNHRYPFFNTMHWIEEGSEG